MTKELKNSTINFKFICSVFVRVIISQKKKLCSQGKSHTHHHGNIPYSLSNYPPHFHPLHKQQIVGIVNPFVLSYEILFKKSFSRRQH